MKRIIALATMAALILLGGCSKENSVSGDDKIVFADFEGEYPENPLQILTLSRDEIIQVINEQSNFKASDNLYVNIPEKTSVYEYSTYDVMTTQMKETYHSEQYLEDFYAAFDYFFPNREMNLDYLKYKKILEYIPGEWESEDGTAGIGRYETEEGLVKDKKNFPDGSTLTYDEMPEPISEWNSPIRMRTYIEIGGGGIEVNKGEAARIFGKYDYEDRMEIINNELSYFDEKVQKDHYVLLSKFDPEMYFSLSFEYLGEYSPKSEKSFKLLDGEMKICDAVKFFEDYINNAPISTGLQRNCCARVHSVEVMKINEDTYGYYMIALPEFQGVMYERGFSTGVDSDLNYNYDAPLGRAFMVRSDDVDYMYGCQYANLWTFDVKPVDSIIPVDRAIKIISDEMTDFVDFEVQTVEFIYARKFLTDEKGHVLIDTYEAQVTPAWQITAYNPNDDLTYLCFVDAKDGGNFRYYSATRLFNYHD